MNTSSSSSTSSSTWVRGACVGRGCFGTVNKAVSQSDGLVFAVKSVNLATCLPSQADSLENEIVILRSLKSHPHVVKFLGDDVSKEGTSSFRNLHLEYLPEGDVSNKGRVVDETLLRRYIWCLVSALRHVHLNGIVHCDVKCKNVLIADGGNSVKLTDFGSAMELTNRTVTVAPRGSPLWMAPEVIRREYQGPESDVWSLGCTVIEMLTGKPPWEDTGIFDSLSRIGFSDEIPFIPTGVSDPCRDFLDKCLRRDRSLRWSCDQLLQHPFLRGDRYSVLTEPSPRCVLDWVNSDFEEEEEGDGLKVESMVSAMARISKLAITGGAIWESNGWIDVRGEESGVKSDFLVPTTEEEELAVSTVAMTCELSVLLLVVVENIRICITFYTSVIIVCCYYFRSNNKKKKKIRKNKTPSLIFSLNFFFLCLCSVWHVIRIGLSNSRKLLMLRGVIECFPNSQLLPSFC